MHELLKRSYLLNLSHHFLLSMPQMLDTRFSRTLTYVCDHDERGALGLVINRRLDMDLAEIFQQMDIEQSAPWTGHREVYEGGPVDPAHGLILHHATKDQEWAGTHRFNHDICISSSRDILQDIAAGRGPEHFLVILGHAGWGPGQLEDELAENAWLTCPADPAIIFATAVENRLQKAAESLGIDLTNLSSQTGHA